MAIKRAKRVVLATTYNLHDDTHTYRVEEITNSLKWHPGEEVSYSELLSLVDGNPEWTIVFRAKT